MTGALLAYGNVLPTANEKRCMSDGVQRAQLGGSSLSDKWASPASRAHSSLLYLSHPSKVTLTKTAVFSSSNAKVIGLEAGFLGSVRLIRSPPPAHTQVKKRKQIKIELIIKAASNTRFCSPYWGNTDTRT